MTPNTSSILRRDRMIDCDIENQFPLDIIDLTDNDYNIGQDDKADCRKVDLT
ncbi:MAG: hypothetical protein M0T73_05985 [Deltaproteobacteria bacterium]|nr:hypothetical protein [Deltaproteobacteria bacterium]